LGAAYAAALDEAAIVAITDADGRIVYCNDRFCRTSGYSRDELIGATHRIINSGLHSKAFFQELHATIADGRTWRGAIRNRKKTGEFYWLDTTIVPQMDEQGRPRAFIAVRYEVTDQMAALEELAAARRIAEKASAARAQLLADVSHELRTPLTGVLGLVDLLETTGLSPDQRSYVQAIRDACRMQSTIVDDVLTSAQAETSGIALDPQPADIRRTLQHVQHLMCGMAQARGVNLRIDVAPEVPEQVELDALRLSQILSNLIGDSLRSLVTGEVRIGVAWIGSALQFVVSDTGPGCDPLQRARVHASMAAGSQNVGDLGLGSGFPIAVRIIQAMGGTLQPQCSAASGCAYRFSVPCREWIAEPQAPEEAADQAPSALVVEDNPVIQMVLRHILESAGCHVDVASDGALGVAQLQAQAYDICFMDIRMPVMDGRQAVAAIRRDPDPRVRNTPVVAVSADILLGEGGKLRDEGFDGFIPKPIEPEAILHAAFAATGRSARGDAAPMRLSA